MKPGHGLSEERCLEPPVSGKDCFHAWRRDQSEQTFMMNSQTGGKQAVNSPGEVAAPFRHKQSHRQPEFAEEGR